MKSSYFPRLSIQMLACFLFAPSAFAQALGARDNSQDCVSGYPGNQSLVRAFKSANLARDPVLDAFYKFKAGKYNPPINNVQEQIKLDCIRASLGRGGSEAGVVCNGENGPVMMKVGGSTGEPCITNEMVEYMQFTIRIAMECLSVNDVPLDPRIAFQKFNNETAFHFYVQGINGHGLGQLTSDGAGQIVRDLESSNNFIVERVYSNPSPACAPFKRIVEDDVLNRQYKLPKNTVCFYTAPERGLARNILYSLALYSFYRQIVQEPRWGGTPNVSGEGLQYAALIAFGREGPRGGAHAASRIANQGASLAKKKKTNSEAEQTLELVRSVSNSSYLSATMKAYGELFNGGRMIQNPQITFDTRAGNCVERIGPVAVNPTAQSYRPVGNLGPQAQMVPWGAPNSGNARMPAAENTLPPTPPPTKSFWDSIFNAN